MATKGPYFADLQRLLLKSDKDKDKNLTDCLDVLATALNVSSDEDVVSEEAVEFLLSETKPAARATLLQVLQGVKKYIYELAYQEALLVDSRPLRRSRLMIGTLSLHLFFLSPPCSPLDLSLCPFLPFSCNSGRRCSGENELPPCSDQPSLREGARQHRGAEHLECRHLQPA